MFAGIYYGGMYGGSTTSILLNTPGESASIVTAIEGNKMARKGRGGPALATAAIGSFVAGLIATLLLAFLAPFVVKFALAFGPREYFALMVLAFVTVSAAFGDSALRGLIALFLGLAIGLVGHRRTDRAGAARVRHSRSARQDRGHHRRGRDVRDRRGALHRGAGQPGAGNGRTGARLAVDDGQRLGAIVETVAARHLHRLPDRRHAGGRRRGRELPVLCDREARRPSIRKNSAMARSRASPGPEAANNASAAGTLVPLLTLGLPTTATAAIMLAGFQQYGLQPGPLLFTNNGTLVWALIASLLIANLMLIVLNLPLIGLWVKLLTIPKPWLYAGILLFATLGTIGASPSIFELGLLLAFGLLGFALKIFGFPIAPVIVGLILGPMAEQQLRRALAIEQGDFLEPDPIADRRRAVHSRRGGADRSDDPEGARPRRGAGAGRQRQRLVGAKF